MYSAGRPPALRMILSYFLAELRSSARLAASVEGPCCSTTKSHRWLEIAFGASPLLK
jgi:hypothetical protein